jgi:hypothetical protein
MFMMDEIHLENWEEGFSRYPALYRAVDTSLLEADEQEFWSSLEPGETFDAPLLSFLDTHPVVGVENNLLDKFGTDVLLVAESSTGYGYSSNEFSNPIWLQDDEGQWLNDLEITAPDHFNWMEDDGVSVAQIDELTSEFRSSIESYRATPSRATRSNLVDALSSVGLEESSYRFAGDAIDEATYPDAFYGFYDFNEGPTEVVSGGRFSISRVETDPTGHFDQVVYISQDATFDPLSPGDLAYADR